MALHDRSSKRKLQREALLRLAVTAALIALYVVLNRFVSISLPGAKIGFSVICPMIAAMLYGPLTGGIVYALGDLLSALLFPFGTFHPGFTVTAFLMGVIWGLFTHPHPFGLFPDKDRILQRRAQKPDGKRAFLTILRLSAPALLNCLLLGLFVNTIWVAQLNGSRTYWGWFVYRLAEYAIMVPVNVILAFLLLPVAELLRKKGFVRSLRGARADAQTGGRAAAQNTGEKNPSDRAG